MKSCFAIIRTRSFYGPKTEIKTDISLVMEDTGLQYLTFATRQEAKAWIRFLEGREHSDLLKPMESRPPTYLVTEVGSENFRDAYKRTRGGADWPFRAVA